VTYFQAVKSIYRPLRSRREVRKGLDFYWSQRERATNKTTVPLEQNTFDIIKSENNLQQ
jgi:hypothetical protein